MHVCACVRLVCKPHAKQLVLIQQVSRSIDMSASHSPAIGDKPMELLMIAEWCDFGRGLKILIVTKLYIVTVSPVVKTLFIWLWHAL